MSRSRDNLLLIHRGDREHSGDGELGPIVSHSSQMADRPGFVVVSMHWSDRCVEAC